MRGCSAQAVQSASSGGREHFEDAAAAFSAANTEFLGLPSQLPVQGSLLTTGFVLLPANTAWAVQLWQKVPNALSGTADTARSHSTLGQGTCYRLARAIAESVHLLERVFDFLQRREFQ